MKDKPTIIGCDEVGTGALSGPIIVCGVRATKDWSMPGLNDSKKLSEKKRLLLGEELSNLISKKEIVFHIAERSNVEIDKVGLASSLKSAYVECFHNLYEEDCIIISDGNLKFDNLGVDAYDKISIIKADSKFQSVMAASILAKNYRDSKMKIFHELHPQFDWINNVGYGSKIHLAAIKEYGPSALHRFSYKPMKDMTIKVG